MVTQVSHDGFSRHSLMRETVKAGEATCAWCGQAGRFRYQYEDDASTRPPMQRRPLGHTADKVFCGIGCFRDYHS